MLRFASIQDASGVSEVLTETLARKDLHRREERECSQAYHQGLTLQGKSDLDGAAKIFESLLARPLLLLVSPQQASEPLPDEFDGVDLAFARKLRFAVLKNLGVVEELRHRPDAALAAFAEAVSVDPNDTVPWFRLGSLALRSGKLAVARHALESALSHSPTHPLAQRALADTLYLIGDFPALQRLLSLHEHNSSRHLGALKQLAAGEMESAEPTWPSSVQALFSKRHDRSQCVQIKPLAITPIVVPIEVPSWHSVLTTLVQCHDSWPKSTPLVLEIADGEVALDHPEEIEVENNDFEKAESRPKRQRRIPQPPQQTFYFELVNSTIHAFSDVPAPFHPDVLSPPSRSARDMSIATATSANASASLRTIKPTEEEVERVRRFASDHCGVTGTTLLARAVVAASYHFWGPSWPPYLATLALSAIDCVKSCGELGHPPQLYLIEAELRLGWRVLLKAEHRGDVDTIAQRKNLSLCWRALEHCVHAQLEGEADSLMTTRVLWITSLLQSVSVSNQDDQIVALNSLTLASQASQSAQPHTPADRLMAACLSQKRLTVEFNYLKALDGICFPSECDASQCPLIIEKLSPVLLRNHEAFDCLPQCEQQRLSFLLLWSLVTMSAEPDLIARIALRLLPPPTDDPSTFLTWQSDVAHTAIVLRTAGHSLPEGLGGMASRQLFKLVRADRLSTGIGSIVAKHLAEVFEFVAASKRVGPKWLVILAECHYMLCSRVLGPQRPVARLHLLRLLHHLLGAIGVCCCHKHALLVLISYQTGSVLANPEAEASAVAAATQLLLQACRCVSGIRFVRIPFQTCEHRFTINRLDETNFVRLTDERAMAFKCLDPLIQHALLNKTQHRDLLIGALSTLMSPLLSPPWWAYGNQTTSAILPASAWNDCLREAIMGSGKQPMPPLVPPYEPSDGLFLEQPLPAVVAAVTSAEVARIQHEHEGVWSKMSHMITIGRGLLAWDKLAQAISMGGVGVARGGFPAVVCPTGVTQTRGKQNVRQCESTAREALRLLRIDAESNPGRAWPFWGMAWAISLIVESSLEGYLSWRFNEASSLTHRPELHLDSVARFQRVARVVTVGIMCLRHCAWLLNISLGTDACPPPPSESHELRWEGEGLPDASSLHLAAGRLLFLRDRLLRWSRRPVTRVPTFAGVYLPEKAETWTLHEAIHCFTLVEKVIAEQKTDEEDEDEDKPVLLRSDLQWQVPWFLGKVSYRLRYPLSVVLGHYSRAVELTQRGSRGDKWEAHYRLHATRLKSLFLRRPSHDDSEQSLEALTPVIGTCEKHWWGSSGPDLAVGVIDRWANCVHNAMSAVAAPLEAVPRSSHGPKRLGPNTPPQLFHKSAFRLVKSLMDMPGGKWTEGVLSGERTAVIERLLNKVICPTREVQLHRVDGGTKLFTDGPGKFRFYLQRIFRIAFDYYSSNQLGKVLDLDRMARGFYYDLYPTRLLYTWPRIRQHIDNQLAQYEALQKASEDQTGIQQLVSEFIPLVDSLLVATWELSILASLDSVCAMVVRARALRDGVVLSKEDAVALWVQEAPTMQERSARLVMSRLMMEYWHPGTAPKPLPPKPAAPATSQHKKHTTRQKAVSQGTPLFETAAKCYAVEGGRQCRCKVLLNKNHCKKHAPPWPKRAAPPNPPPQQQSLFQPLAGFEQAPKPSSPKRLKDAPLRTQICSKCGKPRKGHACTK